MEKGKEKFTDGEKQILLSIVRSVKANIDKIECRHSQKLILNWVYDGIIEKVQSNIRFNEVEIECLIELLTERVGCIEKLTELIDHERTAYLVSYERLKFTVQNFKEEKLPSELYLAKKRQKGKETIRTLKTAIVGDVEKARIQEMNYQ